MTPDTTITRIAALPPELEALEALAASEGFNFMTRLLAEWRSFSQIDDDSATHAKPLTETAH
ncbi:hypothetical protein AWB69_05103 [Caballeronia udeis]|uniref:Uncharacterized protein n=1 Tax=Caballeronia udeis TaxID=1232866 RepID=A0A158I161_9BURK|nr:hypothetical protein [Caballeronia udeis]SAL50352.1 hypothetical protein AWB69_05103 [Caballeronia udeis]